MKAFKNGVVNGLIVGGVGAITVKLCQAYNWVALKLPNSAINFNEHAGAAAAVIGVIGLTTLAVSNNNKNHSTAGVFTGAALAIGLTVGSVFIGNPNSERHVDNSQAPGIQIN